MRYRTRQRGAQLASPSAAGCEAGYPRGARATAALALGRPDERLILREASVTAHRTLAAYSLLMASPWMWPAPGTAAGACCAWLRKAVPWTHCWTSPA